MITPVSIITIMINWIKKFGRYEEFMNVLLLKTLYFNSFRILWKFEFDILYVEAVSFNVLFTYFSFNLDINVTINMCYV